MINLDEYVKGILVQILDSHKAISELKDKPGDLEIINKEWLKIIGLLKAMNIKIELAENNSDAYVELLKRSTYYLENYDFKREIEIMSPLYSEDTGRLKNIRLKILESFQDRKLVERIESLIEYL